MRPGAYQKRLTDSKAFIKNLYRNNIPQYAETMAVTIV